MKKGTFLAGILATLGHKVVAELTVDDVTGVSVRFPETSELEEIKEDTDVEAQDGNYQFDAGEKIISIEVKDKKVVSVVVEDREAGDDTSELREVITAMAKSIQAITAKFEALEKKHTSLVTAIKPKSEPSKTKTASEINTRFQIK